ncbi:hypothetical protein C8Q73DRAFT_661138, partial [Cubamyces lactineus]
MTYSQRLAFAVRYFKEGGSALAVGHHSRPETMYHNESLYPGMYPWLFPYGVGGFENARIVRRLDRVPHLRACLVFGDRRFQFDRSFSYVAFSHSQVRNGTASGYLLTKCSNFRDVADKILSLDPLALDAI